MAQNISKYVQLNDFLLLEYEFNRDASTISFSYVKPFIAETTLGAKQFFNKPGIGVTNNTLELQSEPIDSKASTWYINPSNPASYYSFFDSSTLITTSEYPHDTIKVHVVSGYNFDEIAGFLLQVKAEDTSSNLVNMSNFTWIKQVQGSYVVKFAVEPLYLGNRFYDKYVELKIPSIGTLGGQSTEDIESKLSIKSLSDVFLTYSTITEIDNYTYTLSEQIDFQLPVQSNADNFNCFIAESTSGDYIEYYATWKDSIIGEYIGDIESGRIALFTSNNPNDNYQQFVDDYGAGTAKWVVIHELQLYEHIPPGTSLMTQRYQFTQEGNFLNTNKFRPVIINADIASSYTIDYICRLTNRMDGSQIIRKASFSSVDPKKYGRVLNRINVDNYIPYKIFNKIPAEKANIVSGVATQKIKYNKIFYDTTNVMLNSNNEIMPQGTGPIFLKNSDSAYKLKFERLNTDTSTALRENIDLSGVYEYLLVFTLDNGNRIEINPTYSSNMNTTLGELEFKVFTEQIATLLKQKNNQFEVMVKNPDNTRYTFYQGNFYSYKNQSQVITQYKSLYNITALNSKIASLESQVKTLTSENALLKSQL